MNRLGPRGVEYICGALAHPDGPKEITHLYLAGSFVHPLLHLMTPNASESDLNAENGMEAEGARHLSQALIHPDGPKQIEFLGLAGVLIVDEKSMLHNSIVSHFFQ